jgi:hypothetical protein
MEGLVRETFKGKGFEIVKVPKSRATVYEMKTMKECTRTFGRGRP